VPEGVGDSAGVAFAVEVPGVVGAGAADAEEDFDAVVFARLDVLGDVGALGGVALVAVDAAGADLAAWVGAVAEVVDEGEDDEVDARAGFAVRCEALLVVVTLTLIMIGQM
jgi:hypothetical protein